MANNNINFKINYQKGDTSALDSLKKELQDIKKLTTNLDMAFDAEDIQKLIPAVSALENALNGAFDVDLNTINVQKFNNILAQSGMNAKKLQEGLAVAGVEGNQAFLHMTSQLMKFNTATKQTNQFLNSIATSLFNTIKWTAMSSIVNNVTGSVQKAFYYVKDLDRSLNDIQIVTSKSADEMSRFAVEANKAAKELAVTTADYTEGSLIYYQQGLDDETVKTLTDITAKTSNVTQQSMETVSEQLTAVWNGYKVANEAAEEGMGVYEEYVDKMAAVGAATASDLEELSIAMSKVASAASSMGVNFDDLNAQIATIVSVTRQAPESVGTALKTIYARLGDLKVDGVDEFGTKLGEVSSQLETMGIKILDTNGDMRDMSSVMAEVAEKWDTWTSAQRQAAAVAMAGKRQYNNLVALFDNWDMYGESLETSMNAAGTLEKQQEIALESLANKMDILKATAEGLYASLIDEDTLKGGVEALTNIVELLSQFTQATGGLNNLLPMLGSTALRVFNDQIASGIGTVVINLKTAQREQEVMRQNQAQLQAMFQDSALFQTTGSDKVNAAAVEGLEKLKTLYAEMVPYQSIMTQEEKEQYNYILQLTEKAGSLNVELAQQKDSWQESNNYLKIINADLMDNLEDITAISSEINKVKILASEIDGLSERITKNDRLRDAQNHFTTFEKFLHSFEGELKLSDEQIKQLMQRFDKLGNIPLKDKLKAISDELRNIGNGANEIVKLDSEMKSASSSADTLGNSLKESLDIKQQIANITTTIGAIGQLTSAISMLGNLGEIWNNDNLTGSEKFLQTITNLSFVVPMFLSSIQVLNTTFKLSTTLSTLFGKSLIGLTGATESATAAQWGLNAAMEANPIGVIILGITALVAIIAGAVAAYDALTISAEEAAEALEKSNEEYKEAKNELETLKNELETTEEKIKELQSQDSLTLIEEKELQNLQVSNDLLQTQIEQKEQLLKLNKDQLLIDAKQAAFKDSYSTEKYKEITSGTGTPSYSGNEKYKLDTTGISTYTELDTKLKEIEDITLEDATNKNLSDIERADAQAAYEYYQEQKENILKAWKDATEQVQKAAEQAQLVLPSLYDAVKDEEGNYNDENLLYGETIKYFEEKVLEYYKSSDSLQRILTTIAKNTFEDDAEMQEFLNEAQQAINKETQTVDEEVLSKIIGEEQFGKLQEWAQKYQISLYDIITYTQSFNVSLTEELGEVEQTLDSKINSITEKIGSASSALDTLMAGKELSDEQIIGLKQLESEYEELATIQDRQSSNYIEKLREIREELEKEKIKLKELKEAESIDEAKQIMLKVNTEDGEQEIDNLQDKLLDICDADYEVLVEVKSDIQDDFDDIVTNMENVSNMASKIGDDFIVAAEDLEELNHAFPGILDGMTDLKDGTVQLNQDIVQSAMDTANAEVDAETDATIQKLQIQKTELEQKRDAAQKIADIATQLASDETGIEEDKSKVIGQIDEALNTLKSDNSEETARQEQEDNSNVEDSAIAMAQSSDAAVKSSFENQAKNGILLGNTLVAMYKAVQSAAEGGDGAMPGMPSMGLASISGKKNVTVKESNKANLDSYNGDYSNISKDKWKKIADNYQAQADAYNDILNDTEGKIAELKARKSKVDKELDNIANGTGSDGKKSGGKGGGGSKGKDRQEKENKNLEDEFDKYWQLKKAIDATDKAIQKLEKDQENLYGYQLIDSLKKENALLETQKGNYEALLAAQEERAAALRAELGTMGVVFDASGAIVNYAEATANALAAYNAAIQQYNAGLIDETTLGVYEKSFENFKKLLEEYDKLYYTEIQETKDKIDEIVRKQKENNLKAWETEIQIKLDWQELKRGWNDFRKEMSEDFKKVFKDLKVESKNLLKNAKTYTKKDGTIKTELQAIKDVEAEIDKMMAGGESDMFESVSQAQEKLKELNEKLQNDAKALHDMWKQAWQNYLDGIDQVDDKLEAVYDRYEDITEEIEFQVKLIKLLYGDSKKGRQLMGTYYDAKSQMNLNQITTTRKEAEMWQKQFEKSGANINRPDKWNEDQKKLYENWMNAQQKLNDLVAEQVELLQDEYKNTVDNILDDLNKRIEETEENWEKVNKEMDRYYDRAERSYQIQTLQNKMNQEIDNTKDLKAQQKLQELRDKEIKSLREKTKLREIDVKNAELEYEIALKEIALEEAQNNKTSMKLTRNEQGNWSYQYVADEDDVANKQQDLLSSINELYQLWDGKVTSLQDEFIELQKTYAEKMKEYSELALTDKEEANKKMAELDEWYNEELNRINVEYNEARLRVNDLTATMILKTYEQDQTAYETMTEAEKRLVDELKEQHITDYQDIKDAVQRDLNGIGETSKQVTSDSRADWKSMAAQQIQNINEVKNSVTKAYSEIQAANTKYQQALDTLQKKAGVDFNNITSSIDKAKNATDKLQQATTNLADKGSNDIDKLRKYVEKLEEQWNKVKDAIEAAIKSIEEYLQKRAEANAAEGESGNANGGSGNKDSKNGGGNGNGSGSGSGNNGSGSNKNSDTGRNYYIEGHDEKGNKVRIDDLTLAEAQAYAASYRKGSNVSVKHYDTGGYTGEWGDTDGRFALLHQKELVLNKDDTENFLSGIQMIRDMTSLNGSIEKSILQSIANMAVKVSGINPGSIQTNNSTSSHNNTFNITAEFPNANNVDDIRQAILTLPNIASQYINTNKR